MPIDKEQFLKQFVKQALDERISLFLGAGGSCDAGYPNWADLFAPFARDLGTPINESTDYYRLAQYYSNSFGPGELRKRINERINRNNFESQLLEELIDIGFTNVWTTNFDTLIEQSLEYCGKKYISFRVFGLHISVCSHLCNILNLQKQDYRFQKGFVCRIGSGAVCFVYDAPIHSF